MKTIDLKAMIGSDHKLVVQLPADIPPGEHQVVVVIDETTFAETKSSPMADWPVHDVGPWPENLSFR